MEPNFSDVTYTNNLFGNRFYLNIRPSHFRKSPLGFLLSDLLGKDITTSLQQKKGGPYALDYICYSSSFMVFRLSKRIYAGRFYTHSACNSRCRFTNKTNIGQKCTLA
jgi:hypothetical protein